jgi:cytochrome c oxidase subunit 2
MILKFFTALFLIGLSPMTLAGEGVPTPWQIGFQKAASPVMREITHVHNLLLLIIFAIAIFVIVLILFACWRFRASKNPIPSTVSHNITLEIIWTLIPCLILIVIAIPSFRLLYYMDKIPKADMTVKVVGHQWYWSYEYPDHGSFSFDSYMIPDHELQPGQPRLLAVDNPVVVPVGKVIRIIATSDDVIHSWAVPSLGVKKDTVPGRNNETWFQVDKEGMYYGQCSELCGPKHGFMPIAVKAISEEAFNEWAKKAHEKWG